MSLDGWRRGLIYAVIISLLSLVAVIYAPLVLARLSRDEPFFALGVLGKEGKAGHYYPGDDPNIEVGEPVDWVIYLYNHMGGPRYVALRFKLLNSTMPPPEAEGGAPSRAPVFFEVRRVIANNETILLPFSWSIEGAQVIGDSTVIRRLSAMGETYETYAVAREGRDFRVVIELWIYDERTGDFEFGWSHGGESHGPWVQIWFNATS
jgi:hypothetical protein